MMSLIRLIGDGNDDNDDLLVMKLMMTICDA
jgi:hypothetical protein